MDSTLFRNAGRFLRHSRGNVAITFALCIVPIVFLIGMALDYASAIARQQRLNAAADSAALAAVSPSLMNQSAAQAKTVATNVFSAQASAVTGVTSATPTVTITQNGLARSATVSFTASSTNVFPSVLGQTSWPLTGSATAGSATAANIDFYVMLDNSPSMAIAATTAGINTMIANTPQQGGQTLRCEPSSSLHRCCRLRRRQCVRALGSCRRAASGSAPRLPPRKPNSSYSLRLAIPDA